MPLLGAGASQGHAALAAVIDSQVGRLHEECYTGLIMTVTTFQDLTGPGTYLHQIDSLSDHDYSSRGPSFCFMRAPLMIVAPLHSESRG